MEQFLFVCLFVLFFVVVAALLLFFVGGVGCGVGGGGIDASKSIALYKILC